MQPANSNYTLHWLDWWANVYQITNARLTDCDNVQSRVDFGACSYSAGTGPGNPHPWIVATTRAARFSARATTANCVGRSNAVRRSGEGLETNYGQWTGAVENRRTEKRAKHAWQYSDLPQDLERQHSFCHLWVLSGGDLSFCVRSTQLRVSQWGLIIMMKTVRAQLMKIWLFPLYYVMNYNHSFVMKYGFFHYIILWTIIILLKPHLVGW